MTDHLRNLRYGAATHMLSFPLFFHANNTPALIYDVLFCSFTFLAQAATTYNGPGVTIQAKRHFAICGFKSTGRNASLGKPDCFFQCSITHRMPGVVLMFFRLPHAVYEEHFRRCREIAVWNDDLVGIICQRSW
jgi:hypothetical protein